MRFLMVAILGFGTLGITALGQTPRTTRPVLARSGGFIGLGIQEIDSNRAKALRLREEAGVEVTRVDPDSPAEKAGLKVGDVVVQYNGQRLEGLEQFSRMVRETPPGREVKLDIVRNGAPQTVTVMVGQRRVRQVFDGLPTAPPDIRLPDLPHSFLSWRSAMLGVEGESLGGQLAEYFGVKEGVLVRSVLKGSAAEKAGIKAGDVITRVEGSQVATPADLASRLRPLRGKSGAIVLMRDHREMTVIVTIDDADRADKIFGFGGPGRSRYSIQ